MDGQNNPYGLTVLVTSVSLIPFLLVLFFSRTLPCRGYHSSYLETYVSRLRAYSCLCLSRTSRLHIIHRHSLAGKKILATIYRPFPQIPMSNETALSECLYEDYDEFKHEMDRYATSRSVLRFCAYTVPFFVFPKIIYGNLSIPVGMFPDISTLKTCVPTTARSQN